MSEINGKNMNGCLHLFGADSVFTVQNNIFKLTHQLIITQIFIQMGLFVIRKEISIINNDIITSRNCVDVKGLSSWVKKLYPIDFTKVKLMHPF